MSRERSSVSERYYAQYLFAELERRKKKNPRYSLRAFAQALQVDPSALSRILSGKQELSLQSCLRLVKQLTMSAEERKLFVASVAQGKMDHAARILVQAIDAPTGTSEALGELRFDGMPMRGSVPLQNSDGLELLRQIICQSPDLIYLFGREGTRLFTNDFGAKETNTPEEIIALVQKEISKVFESGKHHCGELRETANSRRYFEFVLTPIFQSGMDVHAVLSHIREVTYARNNE
jgi:plasmid maintenance system antidote protein VapI